MPSAFRWRGGFFLFQQHVLKFIGARRNLHLPVRHFFLASMFSSWSELLQTSVTATAQRPYKNHAL